MPAMSDIGRAPNVLIVSEDELLVLLGDEADLHARPADDEEFVLDLS
jgi:hypothetical protein